MGNIGLLFTKVVDKVPEKGWDVVATYQKIAWTLSAILTFVLLIVFFAANANRTPPVELVTMTATDARVGGITTVDMTLNYDTNRECAQQSFWWIVDAQGRSFYIDKDDFSSAARQKYTESYANGAILKMMYEVPMPSNIGLGLATFWYESKFLCNNLQSWFPLTSRWSAPFIVKP